MTTSMQEFQQEAYDLRLQINRHETELHLLDDPAEIDVQLREIARLRSQLEQLQQRIDAEPVNPERGQVLTIKQQPSPVVTRGGVMRGADTTNLTANIDLKMQYLPTGIYHLLDVAQAPLVAGVIVNSSAQTKRIRVTSYIDGYSAHAIDTVEIPRNDQALIQQLPTLFPERLQHLHELTRATLNILTEDLDGKVETHSTKPIWLLSRNSAPLYVRDPSTNGWNDLSRYLGAFVTPNAPDIMRFLREVARHHPNKILGGYQDGHEVLMQVRAIFEALQTVDITYVNSTLTFNPEESARSQRVRLPRESLEEKQANCIDGVLLFASLMEAASLNPAIVIIPGHAFVAWETANKNNQWQYLETTKLANGTFEDALASGQQKALAYQAIPGEHSFRQWSLRELRTKYQITPLE